MKIHFIVQIFLSSLIISHARSSNYTSLLPVESSVKETTTSESDGYTLDTSGTDPKFVDVKISGGIVRGYVSKVGKRPANVFKGIPMAESPLGKLRFQKLRPRQPWNKVWNATEYRAACLSNTSRTSSPQKNAHEDCIYMNVFGDPKCRKIKMLCPVLFLIHGGKFAFDSAVMYNETQIVQKYASDGVVFVIPAYRLGVFGFLDLGNDNVVPRNLGFHDIIYALEWTKREIKSFGGDPGKVTIMGFSAGASAVEYLLESPKVPQAMFKQAIVCSAVPFFTKNANQPQTLAIMDHVKCLFNETTNRTFSDIEKANCLRKISAQDLINTQRYVEDNFNLRFRSPETDTDILPGENLADMLTTYKARPLLITTTRNEMSAMDSLDVECDKAEIPFGYKTRAVHQACVKRYKKSGKWPKQPSSGKNPNIIAESIHAQSFQISLVNARKGAPTYRGYFTLANHSVHAEDMRFFFGFHFQPVTYTFAERMMDHYYPAMIKNFLKTGVPDTDWQQVDQNGNNYFMLDFQTRNYTIVVKPHPEPGQEDPRSVKFWLLDAFTLEQNEKQRLKQRQNQHSSRRVPENESLPYFPIFSNLILPAFASDTSPSGSNDGQPTVIVNDAGKPVSKVWSGFWLSSEIIVLLLIVIVMLVGSRMLYRYKMVQGYLYKSSNGYLTENTQILSRNEMRKQYTF